MLSLSINIHNGLELWVCFFMCVFQLMEADIGVRETQMQQLGEMADALLASNHFNADKIQAKHLEMAER